MSEIPIPEDLREQYDLARKGVDNPISIEIEQLLFSVIRSHIERTARERAAANVELDTLRAQLRSKDEQLAGMRAEITVAQLKRAGCQGLAALSARPAINRILHERAALSGPSPAQEGTEALPRGRDFERDCHEHGKR